MSEPANILTAVTPKLLAQGLLALRANCVMPRLVNRDFDSLAATKGASIDVPIPSAVEVKDVDPSNTPPSTNASLPTSVPVPLDEWKEAPFFLTDKDLLTCMNGTIPMQASEAISALADTVDTYILTKMYKRIYSFGGDAGTTPFGGTTPSTNDANQARKRLNVQRAPLGNRRFVLDPDAEAAASMLRAFQDVSWSGDPSAIQTGQVKNKLGFDWYMDQNIPTHTAGTITTGLIAKAATAQATGLSTIVAHTAASTGRCSLKEGDILYIAGQAGDQSYVVTENVAQAAANSDVSIKIYPDLVTPLVGSEVITVEESHVVNLAFHRDCFAFATRPLESSAQGLGNIIMADVDPVSGLTLRLEISREHKRTRFSYDILYGGATVRGALGTRLGG